MGCDHKPDVTKVKFDIFGLERRQIPLDRYNLSLCAAKNRKSPRCVTGMRAVVSVNTSLFLGWYSPLVKRREKKLQPLVFAKRTHVIVLGDLFAAVVLI